MTPLSDKSEVFVSFTEINTITNEAGQNKSTTERNRQLRQREGGFCARLLCNAWQRARMFVVVFHTDNRVLTTVTLNTSGNTHTDPCTHNNVTGLEYSEQYTYKYVSFCMLQHCIKAHVISLHNS